MKKLFFITIIFLSVNAYAQVDSLNYTNTNYLQVDSLNNSNINYSPVDSPNNTNINTNTNSNKHKKQGNLKVIGIYAASIILNGIGDGLNNSNNKTTGHIFNALSIGMLLISPFLVDYDQKKWYWYLATYTFLRIGLFDSTYNLTRKLPMEYVGTTSLTDKIYNHLGSNLYILKPISLGIGIIIPLIK
jgi:hypothetical protein